MGEWNPIRSFEYRDADRRRTEGRGDKEPPKWLLKGRKLRARCVALGSAFAEVNCDYAARKKNESGAPFVFEAKIAAAHTCKSKRKEIARIFAFGGENGIIGMKRSGELIVKLVSEDHAKAIVRNLSTKGGCARGVSCLDGIGRYEPEAIDPDKIRPGVRYKLKTLNFQDGNVNKAVADFMLKAIGTYGGAACAYPGDLAVYRVEGEKARAALDYFRAQGVLLSFERMPVYEAAFDALSSASAVEPLARDPGRAYPRLGILDSGIAPIPALAPWIVGRGAAHYPESDLDPAHGTMVAGVALYGDRLHGRELTGVSGGIDIFDAPVVPGGIIYEDELIENVKESLDENHGRAGAWNLSASVRRPVSKDSFSDFAQALDELQGKHGILICKSAGNTDAFLRGEERDPLSSGAESALALTVGSVTHVKSPSDLAEAEAPSPFTCAGPGPECIVKPEVAHYGGNAGHDAGGRLTASGVVTIGPDGRLATVIGTSFSTPRVAATAAELMLELGERADPLLVKTLIVHSAKYPENCRCGDGSIRNTVGFGVPASVRDILHDGPDAATFIMRSALQRKSWVEILDFPMPRLLADGGFYTGSITVTLVTQPILDGTQGREYCQSNIGIAFGTYETEKHHDTTKPCFLNPITRAGGKGCQNMLLSDLYGKRKIKAGLSFGNERTLIEYGDKYHPVKKYAFDLSEARDAVKRKHLDASKKWYLELEGVYREHTEAAYEKLGKLPKQEFCLAITVRDPERRGRLNDEMTRLMNKGNFINEPIAIRSDVEVRG